MRSPSDLAATVRAVRVTSARVTRWGRPLCAIGRRRVAPGRSTASGSGNLQPGPGHSTRIGPCPAIGSTPALDGSFHSSGKGAFLTPAVPGPSSPFCPDPAGALRSAEVQVRAVGLADPARAQHLGEPLQQAADETAPARLNEAGSKLTPMQPVSRWVTRVIIAGHRGAVRRGRPARPAPRPDTGPSGTRLRSWPAGRWPWSPSTPAACSAGRQSGPAWETPGHGCRSPAHCARPGTSSLLLDAGPGHRCRSGGEPGPGDPVPTAGSPGRRTRSEIATGSDSTCRPSAGDSAVATSAASEVGVVEACRRRSGGGTQVHCVEPRARRTARPGRAREQRGGGRGSGLSILRSESRTGWPSRSVAAGLLRRERARTGRLEQRRHRGDVAADLMASTPAVLATSRAGWMA